MPGNWQPELIADLVLKHFCSNRTPHHAALADRLALLGLWSNTFCNFGGRRDACICKRWQLRHADRDWRSGTGRQLQRCPPLRLHRTSAWGCRSTLRGASWCSSGTSPWGGGGVSLARALDNIPQHHHGEDCAIALRGDGIRPRNFTTVSCRSGKTYIASRLGSVPCPV